MTDCRIANTQDAGERIRQFFLSIYREKKWNIIDMEV